MTLDYQRLLPVLKRIAPDRFDEVDTDNLASKELQSVLEDRFSQEELVHAYAKILGIPFIRIDSKDISKDLYHDFPDKTMERYLFVPFKKEENVVHLAVVNPVDYTTLQAIKFLFRDRGESYNVYAALEEDVNEVITSFRTINAEVNETLSYMEEESGQDDENIQTLDDTSDVDDEEIAHAPIAKIVSVILKNAVEGGVSDIHIEGRDKDVRVRFRLDGVLHTSLVLPKSIYAAVVARLKILSNLKIDEHRKPQDGRISIFEHGRKIDFRVSTFPTQYGEKVVLRILDSSKSITDIETLGFWGPRAELIKQSIRQPYGMILVTGPTGSGKSTTLYTLLSMVNNEEVNIVTLEDPVEYYLEGINQSQVKPEIDYTFASGLRSILRQDPDVIMVGEIRDGETAGLAVESALTGHLMFSTLHTNTSIGAIPRLQDMGVEVFLLSSSLEVIIAQRLARKLCPKCKQKKIVDEKLKTFLDKELGNLSQEFMKEMYDGDFSYIYEPIGCDYCTEGYKGRVSVYEALQIDQKMQSLIDHEAKEEEYYEYLKKQDFATMKQDGLLKVLNGHTSLEELLRVVDS